MLKLRKSEPGEEWKGKVTYEDFEVELSDPSQVEEAINKGRGLIVPYPLTACQPCLESEEKCRVILSGPCSNTHTKMRPLPTCCHPGPPDRRDSVFLLSGCGTIPPRMPFRGTYFLSWIQRAFVYGDLFL